MVELEPNPNVQPVPHTPLTPLWQRPFVAAGSIRRLCYARSFMDVIKSRKCQIQAFSLVIAWDSDSTIGNVFHMQKSVLQRQGDLKKEYSDLFYFIFYFFQSPSLQ